MTMFALATGTHDRNVSALRLTIFSVVRSRNVTAKKLKWIRRSQQIFQNIVCDDCDSVFMYFSKRNFIIKIGCC